MEFLRCEGGVMCACHSRRQPRRRDGVPAEAFCPDQYCVMTAMPRPHHGMATISASMAEASRGRSTVMSQTFLVFDSGLGGLTVLREIVAARPDAHIVYVGDDAFFPYGGRPEATLVARIVPLMGELIERHRPDVVVIACNTASVQVLPHLRAHYTLPFVGTVPAIKPACAASRSKRVSVLGTEATVAREYTRRLIRDFARDCAVTLVGSRRLAGLAEAHLHGQSIADAEIAAEIAPCFVEEDGMRTDTVVLACTHYPLLLDTLHRLAPWPVTWVDPAPAIARRLIDLAGPADEGAAGGRVEAVFTSGKHPDAMLAAGLARFGIDASAYAAAN
jgi:glutamate racemase